MKNMLKLWELSPILGLRMVKLFTNMFKLSSSSNKMIKSSICSRSNNIANNIHIMQLTLIQPSIIIKCIIKMYKVPTLTIVRSPTSMTMMKEKMTQTARMMTKMTMRIRVTLMIKETPIPQSKILSTISMSINK